MADDSYHGAIVVFSPVCYTAAPTPSPSPAPTSVPTPSPTVPSTRPELVEARLAAAVHGVDIVFNPGPWSLGLWCHENICSEGTCSVSDLLESGTVVLVGTGASCSWKDDSTVVVTFGTGYTLAENSTVVLSGDYIAGCATCTQYASGSTLVLGRALPPELSSAQFTDTGAQVTLGVLSTIAPSSSEGCTDGDGTSLTLLAGVVRTEIGAFLTSSAACVVVNYPANPDPPFVDISAPGAVGYCDDLTLEGSATMPSIGSSNVTWEVALAGSDPTVDLSNVSRVLEEASSNKELTVTIPSEHLAVENTFSFVLRVDTVLGGSSEAVVEVYKSSLGLLVSQSRYSVGR
ncbi:IPT/TIG domain-containing protein [Ectocarpus siliculosus]|uniref:IPT/TIG domain-containing protein n=1 Tax=Ectocarpus siliculosus TaxID=2880 RepID=D7G0D9_ECTSI|nr:IPT/TIG domain-containing protein [Ectocarpus siliculosus]|eukprot:CBJ26666.1 IPT/TIG domain-containing protein [Ectocarpus siliculosus]